MVLLFTGIALAVIGLLLLLGYLPLGLTVALVFLVGGCLLALSAAGVLPQRRV